MGKLKTPPTEIAVDSRTIDDLSYFEVKELITDYLKNESIETLGDRYGLSAKQIQHVVLDNPVTRAEIERQSIMFPMLRENVQIAEAKGNLVRALNEAILEAMSDDKGTLHNSAYLLDIGNYLDKVQRLNMDKPTDIRDERRTTKSVDYSALLKDLDTDEKKRQFLLEQSA